MTLRLGQRMKIIFPFCPSATQLSPNKPYCAVLAPLTAVPRTTEPEPGLYREGDLAMITFSTAESQPTGTCQGQSKLKMFIMQDQKALFA